MIILLLYGASVAFLYGYSFNVEINSDIRILYSTYMFINFLMTIVMLKKHRTLSIMCLAFSIVFLAFITVGNLYFENGKFYPHYLIAYFQLIIITSLIFMYSLYFIFVLFTYMTVTVLGVIFSLVIPIIDFHKLQICAEPQYFNSENLEFSCYPNSSFRSFICLTITKEYNEQERQEMRRNHESYLKLYRFLLDLPHLYFEALCSIASKLIKKRDNRIMPTINYLYRNVKRMIENPENICSICQNEFINEDAIHFNPCCHIFHLQCYQLFLQSNIANKSCPLCRS